MSIKVKIFLGVIAATLVTVLAGFLAIRLQDSDADAKLEVQRAAYDAELVNNALGAELANLDAALAFKSSSDITYRFAEKQDKPLSAQYFSWEALKAAGLNMMALFDMSGALMAVGAFDLATREAIPTAEFLAALPARVTSPAAAHAPVQGGGVVVTPLGPMLGTYRPVLPTQGWGLPRGTLVAGRLLDAGQVQRIGRQLRMDLSIVPVHHLSPALVQLAQQAFATGRPTFLHGRDSSRPDLHSVFADISGQPALLITVRRPTEETSAERGPLLLSISLVGATGLAALALCMYLLGRSVITPLRAITDHFGRIRESGALTTPLPVDRKDEIGTLAVAFNAMAADLSRTYAAIQHILDSMPSPVIAVDAQGLVTHVNSAARTLCGQGAAQAPADGAPAADAPVSGVPLPRLLPPLDWVDILIREAMDTGQPVSRTHQRVPWGQEQRMVDVWVFPMIRHGQVQGAVVRMDDVTERVRMEELLMQTEKMMSVGGLAAGMAHEINNPLGGILQSVQNIKRRVSLELPANVGAAQELNCSMETIRTYLQRREVLAFLDAIQDSGQRAARIVSDMLEFSRRSESRLAAANLLEILDKSIDLAASDYSLRKQYDFRRIIIRREYEPGIPPVRCTKTEIEQVVLNLIKNAAQALATLPDDAPDPVITLRAMCDGDMARVEVEDNGPGMDEAVRKRVFEPFFTTKRTGMGTGLGLSVSYFIITQNHGGTLTVSSAPGKGARFTITLPLASVCPIDARPGTGQGDDTAS